MHLRSRALLMYLCFFSCLVNPSPFLPVAAAGAEEEKGEVSPSSPLNGYVGIEAYTLHRRVPQKCWCTCDNRTL
ncbi:hypothetical protein F4810DRAFT_96227 [Camillea tinctor]|nr:hypothetical protein F4810DRAFT_96227 [Camillea tinctor]